MFIVMMQHHCRVWVVKQQISPLDTLTFTLIFTLTLALTFTLGFVLVNQWLWIGLPLVIGWLTGAHKKDDSY